MPAGEVGLIDLSSPMLWLQFFRNGMDSLAGALTRQPSIASAAIRITSNAIHPGTRLMIRRSSTN